MAVIAYNGRPHLDECLATLQQQSRAADEVLAIDNGSTDGSGELIRTRFPGVRLIQLESNRGYAGGCNVAAQLATSEVIVFLNQDVRLDPDWLRELIRPLEADPQLAATQSLIMLYDEPSLVNTSSKTVNFLGIGWVTDYRQPAARIRLHPVAFLSGTAFAIRRATFLELRAFDEVYGSYHEDIDLSWRMHLLGSRIMLAPDSRVYHKYQFDRSGRKNFWLERNRLITLFKNYRAGTIALILPAMLVTEVGICILALAEGWIGDKLAGYRDLVRLWPQIRRNRREVQMNRRIADRRIGILLVGGITFVERRQPLVRLGGAALAGYWWVARRLLIW